jgi:hypothetical protein
MEEVYHSMPSFENEIDIKNFIYSFKIENIADAIIGSIESRLEKMHLKRKLILQQNNNYMSNFEGLHNNYESSFQNSEPRRDLRDFKKLNEYIAISNTPSIDDVEKAIQLNRNRLKEIEQLYYIKRGMKIPEQKEGVNYNDAHTFKST